jgi:hypothetical protein
VTKNAAPQQGQDGFPHVQREPKGLKREDAESVWPEPPLPAGPRDRRKIRNQLIVLALAGPVAYLISLIGC